MVQNANYMDAMEFSGLTAFDVAFKNFLRLDWSTTYRRFIYHQ